MTSCQQVHFRVGCQDPEPVMLAPEGLNSSALGQIPYSDTFVLRVGHYHILPQQILLSTYKLKQDVEGNSLGFVCKRKAGMLKPQTPLAHTKLSGYCKHLCVWL